MTGSKYLKLMLISKKLKTPKRILNLKINPTVFKRIWIDVLKNKESDLTNLIKNIKPFVETLSNDLKNNNFNYYHLSILNLIDLNTEISLHKKQMWIESIHNNISSEIYYLIIKRCREIKRIPYNASPEMCEYYFTTDLKYELSKMISKVKTLKPPNELVQPFQVKLTSKIEDLWYNYLYKFYKYGYNKTEISKITNLSRQTIHIEEKKLCHYLKKKQSTI